MNGAESLVRSLLASGVDTCFANPGTSEMHFVAALDKVAGMRCVLGLAETVVTGCADGYGRMAGKPAATLLHCGPGFANGIAKTIVARREAGQLPSTTLGMAALVAEVVKTREPGQNPATRTFQAFRMFINHELDELQQALEASLDVLQPGGRLVVISFHSLEDRMVKQFIAKHSREVYDRRMPFAAAPALALSALGRQRPSEEEVKANPRSRSAIMRVAQRQSLGASA
jgi:hypothetical protein